MKGNDQVIEALNAGLTIELTAINLYFINAKMCKDWGLERLAKHFYDESIEEMKHAEEVIDRILYLERMVVESEESIDWAESQFDLIKMVGMENYLAQQMGEGEEG